MEGSKIHLTKKMVRERELFLGVPAPGHKKGTSAIALKSEKCASNNNTLQQAWNTTGFLPTSINSEGQKNSVRDFEYLKFLNDTIIKDDVLKKFMQKAGEIEEAAGPKSKSPKKKGSLMTPL